MISRRPSAPPLLDARGLCKRLATPHRRQTVPLAVDDVSLTLVPGDVLGLLGLNGAGKSTTLRLLSGCLVPDAGTITIEGYSLSDDPLSARAALGYLADQPPLYDELRVTDFLALCARLRRVPRSDVDTSVATVIDECKLEDVARRRIGSLSKGYRQRVGIAQAIVHSPAVVLLDEPSNGLDPRQMEDMRELVRKLGESRAVLMSSHLLGEVRACCTRIAILHGGKLVAERDLDDDDDAESLTELFTRLVTVSADTTHAATAAAGRAPGSRSGVTA